MSAINGTINYPGGLLKGFVMHLTFRAVGSLGAEEYLG